MVGMVQLPPWRFFFTVLVLSITTHGATAECVKNVSKVLLSELETQAREQHVGITTTDVYRLVAQWVPFSTQNVSYLCGQQGNNVTDRDCLLDRCLTFQEILHLHNLDDSSTLTNEDLVELSPLLSYLARAKSCNKQNMSDENVHGKHDDTKPETLKVWGFGFLFVTIINICSLSGAVVLPFMKMAVYRQMLIFMVGLAVGTLAASGLLVLIPESLGLMYIEEHEISWNYVWKTTTVMGGIYLFFIIERVLKMILDWRESKQEDIYQIDFERKDAYSSIKSKTPVTASQKYKDPTNLPGSLPTSASETPLTINISNENSLSTDDSSTAEQGEQIQNGGPIKRPIATVAWMIIFGDGIHNFIDGLSIGAAFTDSILAGISISLAVICEELPHELGDFAILLNAGMSIKRALMYNFLSACMCYFGLIVGTLLGENTSAHDWIFAIAGGMFLYISLVDMMPEMNSQAENKDNKRMFGNRRIFILQNLGMVIGFVVILLMVVFGSKINFES